MAEHRTRAQIEANRLDLDMFRLAERVREFGVDYAEKSEEFRFQALHSLINANRFHVQKYMHKKDKEALHA